MGTLGGSTAEPPTTSTCVEALGGAAGFDDAADGGPSATVFTLAGGGFGASASGAGAGAGGSSGKPDGLPSTLVFAAGLSLSSLPLLMDRTAPPNVQRSATSA